MSGLLLSSVIVALAAQMPMQMPAQMPEMPTEETVRMVAVLASTEGRTDKLIPEELSNVRSVLEQLSFDTYELIAQDEATAPYEEETRIPINDTYSFHFQPNGPGKEQGTVAFSARIEMQDEPKPLNALKAIGEASRDQTLIFRGLDGNIGEVLVLFKLVQPPQEDQEQSQDNQDRQEQQDQQQEQQQQQQEPSDEEQEPNDLQNIEAILQSLEEMDRREQEESKERPAGVLVPRVGWW